MTLPDLAIAAGVLTAGAAVQSSVGFGMGMFSIPLLVWAGHPLPTAVALVLGAAAVQNAHGAYVARAHIQWRLTARFGALQWLAIGGGVACMGLLVRSDPVAMKQLVGGAVFIVTTAKLALRPQPRDHVGAGWLVLAALTGGFLAGLVGMGGPPLVFFALAHRWPRDTIRAFLWSQFLVAHPILAAALALRFGPDLLVYVAIGAALAPLLWLGSTLGLLATRNWTARRLHTAAVTFLYLIALTSLLSPYL